MWIKDMSEDIPDKKYTHLRVVIDGSSVLLKTLGREAKDAIGYNEYFPAEKGAPFTTYETHLEKGSDFIVREIIDSKVVDEVAKTAHEKQVRISDIENELAELDAFVPRSVEDQIESPDCPVLLEHLTTWNQGRLARKQELRAELASLTP